MAIVQVSVIPIGTGTTSLSKYVADAVTLLEKEKDVKFELTSMGTIVEGDLDKILNLARRMHEAPFAAGVERVTTTIVIDDRRDKVQTMEGKVRSVEERLK